MAIPGDTTLWLLGGTEAEAGGADSYVECAVSSLSRVCRVWFIVWVLRAGKPAHSSNHGVRFGA
jgi:hypothetical protein